MVRDCMKRSVVSIPVTATIREAAARMADQHVGILPVVDHNNMIIGLVGLPDLLALEMPAFFNLIGDLDFVSDFGAVETTRPTAEQVDQPITTLMQPALTVSEESGMLHAYGLMLKHNLSDLPVVSASGRLVGVVSRVDIAAAILSCWKEIKS